MGPNQNPLVPNQNPLTPNQSPYATPSTPSNLGVRPAAQLSAAFLTQAFAWMFVGLLLTAGVAAVVQGNQRLLDFAGEWTLLLIIGQLALVFVIAGAISRISATVALGLFFVATGRPDDRADRQLHHGLGRHGVPVRVGDVRRGRDLRRGDQAFARRASAGSCSSASSGSSRRR